MCDYYRTKIIPLFRENIGSEPGMDIIMKGCIRQTLCNVCQTEDKCYLWGEC